MSRYRKPSIEQGFGYEPGEQAPDGSWAKLNSNESPIDPSPLAIKALVDYSGQLRRYPNPLGEPLRSAVAEYHEVEPSQVVIGAGADQILGWCFRAFADPADVVLLTKPTYAYLPMLAKLASVRVVTTEMSRSGFAPPEFGTRPGRLRFIVNPGEAFPGLMLGGPWGIEDASCPARDNPPVPTWHSSARYRFQVGLGDDLIGYEKPAWSYLYEAPIYTSPDCTTDPHNHHHGLEDESVGPMASNLVAQTLTALLDQTPDPNAQVRLGRYVKADGILTDAYTTATDQGAPGHFPAGAVAIWLAAPGQTTLNAAPGHPDSGTIVALDGIRSFGGRRVDLNGHFMDFDGADQAGPDVSTRGMLVKAGGGSLTRYYVNVYPALTVTGTLGASR